jgi:hypothetical protein
MPGTSERAHSLEVDNAIEPFAPEDVLRSATKAARFAA